MMDTNGRSSKVCCRFIRLRVAIIFGFQIYDFPGVTDSWREKLHTRRRRRCVLEKKTKKSSYKTEAIREQLCNQFFFFCGS